MNNQNSKILILKFYFFNSLDQCIDLNPNDDKYWEKKGKLLEEIQRYEDALKQYNKKKNLVLVGINGLNLISQNYLVGKEKVFY